MTAWPAVVLAAGGQPATEDDNLTYSRIKLALGVAGAVWSWLVLGGIAFSGLSARMRNLAIRVTPGRYRVLAVFTCLLGVLSWLLALPLDYASGFALEHRFGLSTQGIGGWLLDQAKGLLLGGAVGIPTVFALYWMIRRAPRRWWVGVATLFIATSVLLAALAPVLIAPLFNSYVPLQDRALAERVSLMSTREGVAVSEVLVEDTSQRTVKANAYYTGLGPTRRIILADNLVSKFTPDEVAVVVAHELGHQVHDDLWKAIAVGSAFYVAGAYLVYWLVGPVIRSLRGRLRFDRVEDMASLPVLLLFLSVLSFASMPALNACSRAVEHQADVYALNLTLDRESFVSAMRRLAEVNLADPDPPKVIEFIFYSHPPISERIEFAKTYQPQ